MTIANTTTIDLGKVRAEAKRLNGLGALRVTWDNGITPTERLQPFKGRCIGFAISSEERDCLLFLGPYGMRGNFTVMSVDASKILSIEVLGGEGAPMLPGN